MKKIFLILLCFMLVFSTSAFAISEDGMRESAEILVKFNSKINVEELQGEYNIEYKSTIPEINVAVFKSRGKIPVAKIIEALNKNPNIQFAELNGEVTSLETIPNDPMYSDQYALPQINAPKGWDISTGSTSIVIAILDTGVFAHTDLADKIIPGWNFIDNNSNTNDIRGHGTHVAGIATALTNNGKGIAGVDWNARIMPVKVLNDSGSGTYAGVANGVIYATDNNADVINMSLGGSGYSETLELACQYAYDNGVTIVAAAGNSGGSVLYPAKFDTVIAVSAVDRYDNIASFSSRGAEIIVSAPGVSIWSTYPGDIPAYMTMSGTSMACPHVAGLTGLILSMDDSLTPTQVKGFLAEGAYDLGTPDWDYLYGYGRIDVYKTLVLLGEPVEPDPSPPDPDPEPILVTGVSIIEGDQDLFISDTFQFTAIVEPDDADDKSVVWSTNNSNIVVVDSNGLITAVTEGTTNITITTNCGGFTDSVEVAVYAHPEPDPEIYEITTSTNPLNSGQTSGSGLYEDGSQATISVVPSVGYDFINWTLNGIEVSKNLNYTFTVDSNQHYVANLEIKEYTLSYSASSGGYIQGSTTQTVKHGESGTQVTAMSYDNYVFDRWSDGVTTASRKDTNVTANLNATAYFNYVEPEPEYKEAIFEGRVSTHHNQPTELSYDFESIDGLMDVSLSWNPWKSILKLTLVDSDGKGIRTVSGESGISLSELVSKQIYTIKVQAINGQAGFTLVIKNRS